MIIKFPVKYIEEYYPTKRCKKARKHLKTEEVLITVPTITREDDFPIAFKVTNYETVYPRVRDNDALWELVQHGDQRKGIYFTETIRRFKKKLYKPVRHSYGSAIARSFENPQKRLIQEFTWYQNFCRHFANWNEPDVPFNQNSVVIGNDLAEKIKEVNKKAKEFVVFKNILWEQVDEPLYTYTTFGLGHNHGGTGFFIEYGRRCHADRKIYWHANEREHAIKTAVKVAIGRGDTDYVDDIRKTKKMIKKF